MSIFEIHTFANVPEEASCLVVQKKQRDESLEEQSIGHHREEEKAHIYYSCYLQGIIGPGAKDAVIYNRLISLG